MKIIDLKKWNTKLDQKGLVSVKGGATGDHNKSYEYYWTSVGGPMVHNCYEQDSRVYDDCN
jgi:hypothetical protein